MVSNSGPPLPMPMRVPPGHLVQQIVDEEGILTHVILSLYPGPGQSAPPAPPCSADLGPAGGAALTHSVTQANGLVTPGPALVLDPTPHLHSHHHHTHHPHLPVSSVGGSAHLGISVPTLPPFSPHQSISTSGHPTGPPPSGSGAPPHFTAPFLPVHPPIPHQAHFHAPYPFHHPSVCSPGMKPSHQQTPLAPLVPPSPPHAQGSTMSISDYPTPGIATPDNWPVNSVTDLDVPILPTGNPLSTVTVIENGQKVNENNPNDNDEEDMERYGDETGTTRQVQPSENSAAQVRTTGDLKVSFMSDSNPV
ncbi:Fibronectin type III domain-containing protein 3B [Fasciolopsis buskii]|uniref:Fibronectin type III domain-containing protein 3B n=1 Tax=Fasciolopsis buskii TaxID=27845 RepID=A0A8E0RSU6_9TREM|nr:Fibronectin type III domain-containing protein 3B [Fasciolopsis buski]